MTPWLALVSLALIAIVAHFRGRAETPPLTDAGFEIHKLELEVDRLMEELVAARKEIALEQARFREVVDENAGLKSRIERKDKECDLLLQGAHRREDDALRERDRARQIARDLEARVREVRALEDERARKAKNARDWRGTGRGPPAKEQF